MESLHKALKKHREAPKSEKTGVESGEGRHEMDARSSLVGDTVAGLTDDAARNQTISEHHLEQNRLVAGMIRNQYSDVYRMLRVQVLQRMRQQKAKSLAICSANSGDGKTVTAANLALSLAMEPNQSVLLVDLDLRRPRINQIFGLQAEFGLCDYLEEKAEVRDCIVKIGIERLSLLPARRQVLNSSELLSSQRMLDLIKQLNTGQRNQIILFDLPPLLVSDDAMVVLPLIDTSLLVVREGQTKIGELQRCTDLLKGHNLVGTVLNESREDNPYPYY